MFPLSPPCRVSTVLFWSLWERTEKDAFGELVSVGRVGDRRLRCLSGYFDVITLEHIPRRARKVFYVATIEDRHTEVGISSRRDDCDLQGRKINFTNSKTLVGVRTDRDPRDAARPSPLKNEEIKLKNQKM